MIRIEKGPCPAWLSENGAAKTSEYIAAPPQKKPSPWRANDVVAQLREECKKKCMYCEAQVEDVSYGAVEHIRPKERFVELVLAWENLGWACPRCNTNKGAYWTETPSLRLLNPYEDEPNEHIAFAGPFIVASSTSERAQNTVRKLKLNEREDLFLSRARRIEELDGKIRLWAQETDVEKKALFAEDVVSAISPERSFSAALEAFARWRGFDERTSK